MDDFDIDYSKKIPKRFHGTHFQQKRPKKSNQPLTNYHPARYTGSIGYRGGACYRSARKKDAMNKRLGVRRHKLENRKKTNKEIQDMYDDENYIDNEKEFELTEMDENVDKLVNKIRSLQNRIHKDELDIETIRMLSGTFLSYMEDIDNTIKLI